MGELKEKMLTQMELKNFSRKTIGCYLVYMKEYVRLFRKSPKEMREEEIVKYLSYLRNENGM